MNVVARWNAILELAPARVLLRPHNNTFYVSQPRVDIIEQRGTIVSPTQHGGSANGAVMDCFRQYTAANVIVVIDAMLEDARKEVRWNPLTEKWQPATEDIDATHLIKDGPGE